MKKTEKAAVENPTVAWAKNHGIKSKKMNGMGHRSWPDRMFMIPGGRPFFIEFKRKGEEPTPLQRDTIAWLLSIGYDVEVHDDRDQAIEALNKRLRAARRK